MRRYLGALMLMQTGGSSYRIDREYFLTDAQGSTFAVLTDWGVPVNANAAMSFDPFGARRDGESGQIAPWTPSLEADLDASTHHGYTGHEQVDSVGVIHMNGRIYDPKLGRFLQADPYVQDATNSQSLNRYSYVLNNPMAFTDPSGYWGQRQQGYLRTAVAIVIACYTGYHAGTLAATDAYAAAAVAFAGGFAAGAVQTGTGKGALLGGVSSLAFFGVNYGFSQLATEGAASGLSPAQYAERALANGAAGGVLASIQGQRFGSGFLSAGLSSTLNPAVDSIPSNPYGQGFMAAVVGGTVSEATGGKFANGAITGAFAYSVGAIAQGFETASDATVSDVADVVVPANLKVEARNFHTEADAAKAAGAAYGPLGVANKQEFDLGIIELGNQDWGYLTPGWGPVNATRVNPKPLFAAYKKGRACSEPLDARSL